MGGYNYIALESCYEGIAVVDGLSLINDILDDLVIPRLRYDTFIGGVFRVFGCSRSF
jgi:hypothetical protein